MAARDVSRAVASHVRSSMMSGQEYMGKGPIHPLRYVIELSSNLIERVPGPAPIIAASADCLVTNLQQGQEKDAK